MDKEIREKQKTLQDLQDSIKIVQDIKVEKELRENIENLMENEEIMWAQRARSTWIIEGDRNTTFFQTLVKQRKARNKILQITTADTSILEELGDIEYYILEHFKNQYSETSTISV